MDVADLFVDLTTLNQPVAGSFIVSGRRDCVFVGVIIVNGPTRLTQTMTQELCVRF
jgi:hypothetical protein